MYPFDNNIGKRDWEHLCDCLMGEWGVQGAVCEGVEILSRTPRTVLRFNALVEVEVLHVRCRVGPPAQSFEAEVIWNEREQTWDIMDSRHFRD